MKMWVAQSGTSCVKSAATQPFAERYDQQRANESCNSGFHNVESHRDAKPQG